MQCKKCSSESNTKNGIVNNKQRYKCKSCGCNYTEGDARTEKGKSQETKRFALFLYLEGNGFRGIERILKARGESVSHVAVIKWIRSFGKTIENLKKETSSEISIVVMELDEMWHFIQKKQISAGCGSHMIDKEKNLLLSYWDVEGKRPEENCGRR